MMANIRPAPLFVLGLIAVYLGIVWAVPYRVLSENVVAVGTAIASLGWVAYFGAAMDCLLHRGWPPREKWASLAMWMLFTGVLIHGLISLLWRLSDQPAYLVNNPVYTSWLAVWVIPATMILVAAPNLFGRGVPPRSRFWLGLAWLLAFGCVTYLAVARPDLTPIANALQPHLDIGVGYGAD